MSGSRRPKQPAHSAIDSLDAWQHANLAFDAGEIAPGGAAVTRPLVLKAFADSSTGSLVPALTSSDWGPTARSTPNPLYICGVAMVRVELVDASTGKSFATAHLPVEQLPESFAASTTLHLGDADWHVEAAEPVTRAEYTATGALRLTLRKLVQVDPKTILFSLPTLENVLPPTRPGSAPVRLHQDDWRQIELVTADQLPAVMAELAAIRDVIASRKGAGFTRIHVRDKIVEPLQGVRVEVAGARRPLGIGDELVDGGFAIDDGAIYGREHLGTIVALCLRIPSDHLDGVARAHGLLVVDWCRATVNRFGNHA
ncbi:MAG TPA: hypothetical protein VMJ10_14395 [Kofleriaceae bacterium]|nr:hypothetical protein [Kofleriaceae bacterium]